MSTIASTARPPGWFWAVAGLALVWNLIGCFAYIQQMTMGAEALAQLPPAEAALYANVPAWAAAGFGVAVFGGAGGSALLLIRNRLAVPLFGASLLGVIVQMVHAFAIAGALDIYGPSGAILPATVVLIGVSLFLFARRARALGWLR